MTIYIYIPKPINIELYYNTSILHFRLTQNRF